jgi:hypothetical protein
LPIKLLHLAAGKLEAEKLTRLLVEKLIEVNAPAELKTFVTVLTSASAGDPNVRQEGIPVFSLRRALGDDCTLMTALLTKAPGAAALLFDALFAGIQFCEVHKANFSDGAVHVFDHVPNVEEVGQTGGVVGAVCERLEVSGILKERKMLGALASLHTSSPLFETLAVRAIIQYHWSVSVVALTYPCLELVFGSCSCAGTHMDGFGFSLIWPLMSLTCLRCISFRGSYYEKFTRKPSSMSAQATVLATILIWSPTKLAQRDMRSVAWCLQPRSTFSSQTLLGDCAGGQSNGVSARRTIVAQICARLLDRCPHRTQSMHSVAVRPIPKQHQHTSTHLPISLTPCGGE